MPKKAATTARKTTATRSSRVSSNEQPTMQRRLAIKREYVVVGVLLIIAALGVLLYRNFLVVGTVNGEAINRLVVLQQLERQQGKDVVNSIVTQILISQEAKKKNIVATEDDINKEIKKIEDNLSKQGQKLDQVLALNGMTQATLRDQVKTQVLIEKLIGKDIKIADKEIADYIEQNKESLAEGVNTEDQKFREDIREQLRQQKLNEKFQTWLAEVRKNAKI